MLAQTTLKGVGRQRQAWWCWLRSLPPSPLQNAIVVVTTQRCDASLLQYSFFNFFRFLYNCQLLLLLLCVVFAADGSVETRKLLMKGSVGQYPYDFLFTSVVMCWCKPACTQVFFTMYCMQLQLTHKHTCILVCEWVLTTFFALQSRRCFVSTGYTLCNLQLPLNGLLYCRVGGFVVLAELVLLRCCFCVSSDDVAPIRQAPFRMHAYVHADMYIYVCVNKKLFAYVCVPNMCMHMCQIHMYVSICIQCAIVCLLAATHAQSNTLIAVW